MYFSGGYREGAKLRPAGKIRTTFGVLEIFVHLRDVRRE